MFVYLLTNLVNGKMYVGKTKHRNLNSYLSVKRWAARRNRQPGMPVVRAMAKHGIENFAVDILARPLTLEQMDELEILWILLLDVRNPEVGYNICLGGSTGRLGLQNSDEHNRKIGAANKGRKPKGYVRTEEHRRQLRERMQGNKYSPLTPELSREWRDTETPEMKAARFAAIKRAWESYTPDQRAVRIAKMKAGRKKGGCEIAEAR